MMNRTIKIRDVSGKDPDVVWLIIQEVIETVNTYVFDPGSGNEMTNTPMWLN